MLLTFDLGFKDALLEVTTVMIAQVANVIGGLVAVVKSRARPMRKW